jgi:hypothetical protein
MPCYDVFIAYETQSTKDRAKFLKDNLFKLGIYAFEAQSDIKKGDDWKKTRNNALQTSPFFVALVTSYVAVSDEFEFEFKTACKLKKKIIISVEKGSKTDIVFNKFPQMEKLQRARDFTCYDDLLTSISDELLKDNELNMRLLVLSRFKTFCKHMKLDPNKNKEKNVLVIIERLQELSKISQNYKDNKELMREYLLIFRKKNEVNK